MRKTKMNTHRNYGPRQVYFLLAGFNILTVCISLFMNHQLVAMHESTVKTNRVWVNRSGTYIYLNALAAKMNAPGNDVFESRNADEASSRLDTHITSFSNAIMDVRQEIQSNLPADRATIFLQHLDLAKASADMQVIEARRIFSSIRSKNMKQAGERMAAMDHAFYDVIESLASLNLISRQFEQDDLEKQSAIGASMRKFEYFIAVLIAIMVLFAAIYGYKIADRAKLLAEHQKQAAEAADLAKSVFLANMSHEIRTPLTAILGHIELLETDGDMRQAPKSRRDALRAIRRNGDHLLDVIGDILDLSKIEAGKMQIDIEPCDPVAIVSEVVDALRPRLETDVSISIVGASDVPRCIMSSRKALRQIMLNIIGNAVKFTPSGEIKIEISQSIDDLIFDVSDTGEGMADTTGLFQAFYQLDNSRERTHEGTGLGLAISKRLAEAMGGSIVVMTTTPSLGSTFRVTLPNNKCEKMLLPERNLVRLRILLAEDSEDTRAIITAHLRRAGAKVESVQNGSEALEQVSRQEFDIIVMDMRMPIMDGWKATRMIRSAGFDTPVIALTSADNAKCVEAGCDACLPKPVDMASLISTIQECLAHTEHAV